MPKNASSRQTYAQKYGYAKSLVVVFAPVFCINAIFWMLFGNTERWQDIIGWSFIFATFFSIFLVNVEPVRSKKSRDK